MPSPDGNTADCFFLFLVWIMPCLTQFKLLYKLFFFLAAQRNHLWHKLLDKKLSCLEVRLLFQLFCEDRDEQGCRWCSYQQKEKPWPGLADLLWQHNCQHWVSMVHMQLPISLCRNGEVVCHRSAWQERWNGEEGKGHMRGSAAGKLHGWPRSGESDAKGRCGHGWQMQRAARWRSGTAVGTIVEEQRESCWQRRLAPLLLGVGEKRGAVWRRREEHRRRQSCVGVAVEKLSPAAAGKSWVLVHFPQALDFKQLEKFRIWHLW